MEQMRLPVFAERFAQLRGNRTQGEFADFLGISRPTVGFYESGARIPDALVLRQIAEKCGVSSDWLIGLSDTQSLDIDIQQVCKFSGLSELVVDKLHSWKHSPLNKDGRYFSFLNHLLESDYFTMFLFRIYSFYATVIAETIYQKLWDAYGLHDTDDSTPLWNQQWVKFYQEVKKLIADVSIPAKIRERLNYYCQFNGLNENQILQEFHNEVLDPFFEMSDLEELCINRYLDDLLNEVHGEAEKYVTDSLGNIAMIE